MKQAKRKMHTGEIQHRIAKWAEQAANNTKDNICPDYRYGLCLAQEKKEGCAKGAHMGPPGDCNIGPAKGDLKRHFAELLPPWKGCRKGPKCI